MRRKYEDSVIWDLREGHFHPYLRVGVLAMNGVQSETEEKQE